jgi:NCS1 family nucleobase:cation symporter-1
VAIVALVLGIIPNVPGFLKSAHVLSGPENIFDTVYVYAWFIGFLVAAGIYLAGTSLAPSKSRRQAADIAPSS